MCNDIQAYLELVQLEEIVCMKFVTMTYSLSVLHLTKFLYFISVFLKCLRSHLIDEKLIVTCVNFG